MQNDSLWRDTWPFFAVTAAVTFAWGVICEAMSFAVLHRWHPVGWFVFGMAFIEAVLAVVLYRAGKRPLDSPGDMT